MNLPTFPERRAARQVTHTSPCWWDFVPCTKFGGQRTASPGLRESPGSSRVEFPLPGVKCGLSACGLCSPSLLWGTARLRLLQHQREGKFSALLLQHSSRRPGIRYFSSHWMQRILFLFLFFYQNNNNKEWWERNFCLEPPCLVCFVLFYLLILAADP